MANAVRVAVSLPLCFVPKAFTYTDLVGPDGHHGFFCKLAFGRLLRHHVINDMVWRARQKADVPSTKEPKQRPDKQYVAGRGATSRMYSETRPNLWIRPTSRTAVRRIRQGQAYDYDR